MLSTVVLCALAVTSAMGKIYFEENFSDGNAWTDRWVESTHKGDDAGSWKLSGGKYAGKGDEGIQTAEDARFYQISAKMDEFSNEKTPLVLQFAVKHEQSIDCGGGYVKILPSGTNQEDFNGDSDYNIMFGPDICGSTRRVHVIFNYNGQNHLLEKEISCPSDEDNHLYTLIVNPDATYEVKIDNESKQTGSLKDDWKMLAPKEIDDPNASKPEDWVDEAMIDDPEDTKPVDWDDAPEKIADPDAEKPEDWDDEADGDWEAPMIPNPEYKGEWFPKRIDNPDYKGPWEHPQIANPDFVDDDTLGQYSNNGAIGIEIWQVKSGTIFDRFLVTDEIEKATAAAEEFVEAQKTAIAAREAAEEAERKQREEERKKAEEEAEAEEDEEEDEDDEEEEEDADGEDEMRDEL